MVRFLDCLVKSGFCCEPNYWSEEKDYNSVQIFLCNIKLGDFFLFHKLVFHSFQARNNIDMEYEEKRAKLEETLSS